MTELTSAPASIPSALSEEFRETRARKAEHARAFEKQRRQQQLALADYVESHPCCLDAARQHVARFLSSPAHSRLHWILSRWQHLLNSATLAEVAAVFRSEAEDTRALRESPPYFGPADS